MAAGTQVPFTAVPTWRALVSPQLAFRARELSWAPGVEQGLAGVLSFKIGASELGAPAGALAVLTGGAPGVALVRMLGVTANPTEFHMPVPVSRCT